MSVVVTGATGTIGREVVRLFSESGTPVRAMGRSAEKLAGLADETVAVTVADNQDVAAVAKAAHGADVMVMITPAAPDAVAQASALIEAARRSGVRKIVRVSAIKAASDGPTDNTRQHAQTELEIQSSGLDHVFLRPSYFMQNMFLATESLIRDNRFSLAMGEGCIGMIDTRDIALCAKECALSDDWNGEALELTGPQSISFGDVAHILSAMSGRQIQYEAISPQMAFEFIDGAGWGSWMAALARDYGAAYGAGWGDFVTRHVAEITGRAPRSFGEFANELFVPAISSA